MWALCRVVYERYAALHNNKMPFDLAKLPEETSEDAMIQML